jgi:imidazolonepropionase
MGKTVIYNIGKLIGILPADVKMLAGEPMGHVECIDDAFLVIEDGIISDFGSGAGGEVNEDIE